MKIEEAKEKQKAASLNTRISELNRLSLCTATVEWKGVSGILGCSEGVSPLRSGCGERMIDGDGDGDVAEGKEKKRERSHERNEEGRGEGGGELGSVRMWLESREEKGKRRCSWDKTCREGNERESELEKSRERRKKERKKGRQKEREKK